MSHYVTETQHKHTQEQTYNKKLQNNKEPIPPTTNTTGYKKIAYDELM